ncbi:hypothetical protein GQ42DRAFT_164967, partial [Ramicandelaber brevisporus]
MADCKDSSTVKSAIHGDEEQTDQLLPPHPPPPPPPPPPPFDDVADESSEDFHQSMEQVIYRELKRRMTLQEPNGHSMVDSAFDVPPTPLPQPAIEVSDENGDTDSAPLNEHATFTSHSNVPESAPMNNSDSNSVMMSMSANASSTSLWTISDNSRLFPSSLSDNEDDGYLSDNGDSTGLWWLPSTTNTAGATGRVSTVLQSVAQTAKHAATKLIPHKLDIGKVHLGCKAAALKYHEPDMVFKVNPEKLLQMEFDTFHELSIHIGPSQDDTQEEISVRVSVASSLDSPTSSASTTATSTTTTTSTSTTTTSSEAEEQSSTQNHHSQQPRIWTKAPLIADLTELTSDEFATRLLMGFEDKSTLATWTRPCVHVDVYVSIPPPPPSYVQAIYGPETPVSPTTNEIGASARSIVCRFRSGKLMTTGCLPPSRNPLGASIGGNQVAPSAPSEDESGTQNKHVKISTLAVNTDSGLIELHPNVQVERQVEIRIGSGKLITSTAHSNVSANDERNFVKAQAFELFAATGTIEGQYNPSAILYSQVMNGSSNLKVLPPLNPLQNCSIKAESYYGDCHVHVANGSFRGTITVQSMKQPAGLTIHQPYMAHPRLKLDQLLNKTQQSQDQQSEQQAPSQFSALKSRIVLPGTAAFGALISSAAGALSKISARYYKPSATSAQETATEQQQQQLAEQQQQQQQRPDTSSSADGEEQQPPSEEITPPPPFPENEIEIEPVPVQTVPSAPASDALNETDANALLATFCANDFLVNSKTGLVADIKAKDLLNKSARMPIGSQGAHILVVRSWNGRTSATLGSS